MSIVHTIADKQLKNIYRTLSSGILGITAATIQLLTKLALVSQSSTSDMLYRLVVSGFNAWPKLLSKKGSMREKEIQRASKKQRTDQWADIRSYAVSLLIAILSNGNTTTKECLLGNYLLISPLVKFLPLDRDSTIINLLNCLSNHILLDKKISRSVKSVFFNTDHILYRIISLHGRHAFQDPVDLDNVIRQFLSNACTTTGNGICFEDRGWYPRVNPAAQDSDSRIHNGSLLQFLQRLRPLENDLHYSLTLEILGKCAELRAPYFSKLVNPTQPSLTFSFISEVNFWIEIINLPLPKEFTSSTSLPDEPPPTAIVLANLLPPFSRSNIWRTLSVTNPLSFVTRYACWYLLSSVKWENWNQELTRENRHGRFNWTRSLKVSHGGYPNLLPYWRSIRRAPNILWHQPAVWKYYLCMASYCRQSQTLKKLIPNRLSLHFRKNGLLWHQSTSWIKCTCWDLYMNTAKSLGGADRVFSIGRDLLISLDPGQSLVATLLRKRISIHHPLAKKQMEFAVDTLLRRSNSFQSLTTISPILELCRAIDDTVEDEPDELTEALVEFIEDSFVRFMQQPYSFFDEAASLICKGRNPGVLSSILVTFGQQWKYLRSKEKDVRKFSIITEWICHFFLRLVIIGESSSGIVNLLTNLDIGGKNPKISQLLENILRWSLNLSARDPRPLLPGSRYCHKYIQL